MTEPTLFAQFTPLEQRAAVINQATFNALDGLCSGQQPAICTPDVFSVYKNVRELVQTAEEITTGQDLQYGLNLDEEGLGFALRWTSAEELLAQGSTAKDFASSQVSTLGNRISAIRAVSRANLYARYRTSELMKYGYASNDGIPAGSTDSGANFSRFSTFFDVSNGFGRKADTTFNGISTNGNEDAFDYNGYEYTLGADYRFSDSLVAGGLLGYTDRYVDFDSSKSIVDGDIKSNGFSLIGFAQWDQLHYYASASVGYQQLGFDTYRVISYPSLDPGIASVDTATAGSPDSKALLATANFGVPFQLGPVGMDLYLGADYQKMKIDAFSEHEVDIAGGSGSGFQYNVAGQNIKSLDATAGARLAYTWTPRFGVLVPYLRAEYHRQLETARAKLFLNFANLPDAAAEQVRNVVGAALLSDKPDDAYLSYSAGVSAVILGSSRVNAAGRGAVACRVTCNTPPCRGCGITTAISSPADCVTSSRGIRMNMAGRRFPRIAALCVIAAVLAGCSARSGSSLGGSAGKQTGLAPLAVITPIGNVADATGTLVVRSGAEVLLSSKDSDGRDSAILGVTWTPVNAAAQAVPMLERGANAMSFRAPVPPDATPLELRFKLTIRTADGDTSDSEIAVKVNRVPDPDDFLLSDVNTSADAVNLVVVASASSGAASFSTDIPFTLSVQKQVRYNRAITIGTNPSANPAANDPLYCASADPAKTCVKIGPPLQLSGTWKASTGVVGTLRLITTPITVMGAAYQNPRFRLRPPSLNADEVNFAVLTGGSQTTLNGTGVSPDDTRRNNLLYTADIGDAEAEYAITMSSTDLAATGRRPDLLVFAANNADSSAPLTFLGEGVAAVGDASASTTITGTAALDSIKAAGTGIVESRDTAAAYYAAIDPTNQKATLDGWLNDNCLQRPLAGAPGYYGSDIHSTYLNNRDLGFGREMYFKTDCTTAQRGATGATINTVNGERASIVFNYSSLEGAIKRSGAFLAVAMEYRADANGGIKYTRFYTFAPDPRTGGWKRVHSANFDGRRERYTPGNCTVCHGGKPKASYATGADLGATFIPWDANALLFSDTDTSIVDDRLKSDFTRAEQLPNIQALNVQGVKPVIVSRMADTQPTGDTLDRFNATLDLLDHWYSDAKNYDYVPPAWHGLGSAGDSSDTLYGTVIAENCRMCHLQRITDASNGALVASTAPQFNSFADPYISGNKTDVVQQRIFQQHLMPGSRLTSDRFWVTQPGATQSAAQVLATHLGLTLPAATPSVAAVADQPAPVDPGQSGASVRLSGLQSRFASSYSWTLQKPAGSNAVLVGANTAEPAFLADATGNYIANLTVTDAAGNSSSLATPITIVANRKPVGGNYKPVGGNYVLSPNPGSGQRVTVDLFGVGGARPGDGANTVTILAQPTSSDAAVQTNCTTSCTLSFTATASGTIQYRITDADGDSATGNVVVTVSIPGGWNVNPGNTANPNVYNLSCTSPCTNVGLGFNPSTLAQNALSLSASQFNALGYSVVASITAGPTARGRATTVLPSGAAGNAAASSTALLYSSPAFFVSTRGTGNSDVPDTFQFQIAVRNSSNAVISTSQTGTVQMTITPRLTPAGTGLPAIASTWSNVFTTLRNATCISCHGAARSPLAYPNGEGRAWGSLSVDTSGATTYDDLAGTRRTQCPAVDASPPYCVDFNNPSGSLLLNKPIGNNNHGLPIYSTPQTPWSSTADSVALGTIQNWILDGAYAN